MKVKVFVYLVNEDFSPEYAEANHNGEATENNIKYHWEDVFELNNDIKTITRNSNSTYSLQGIYPDESSFSFDIPNIHRIDLEGDNQEITSLAFSENIYHSIDVKESENRTEIHVFLKDYEVFANPISGIYIYSKDFPKELAQ